MQTFPSDEEVTLFAMSTCTVGTIQQYSVFLPSRGESQAKGLGDETAHEALQAEAVGPMACMFILLNTSLTPGLDIFHVYSQLEWMLSWSGSCVWIFGGKPCSVLVLVLDELSGQVVKMRESKV